MLFNERRGWQRCVWAASLRHCLQRRNVPSRTLMTPKNCGLVYRLFVICAFFPVHAEDGSAVGGLFAMLPAETQAIVRPFLYSKYVVQDIGGSKHAHSAAAAQTSAGGGGESTAGGASAAGRCCVFKLQLVLTRHMSFISFEASR